MSCLETFKSGASTGGSRYQLFTIVSNWPNLNVHIYEQNSMFPFMNRRKSCVKLSIVLIQLWGSGFSTTSAGQQVSSTQSHWREDIFMLLYPACRANCKLLCNPVIKCIWFSKVSFHIKYINFGYFKNIFEYTLCALLSCLSGIVTFTEEKGTFLFAKQVSYTQCYV